MAVFDKKLLDAIVLFEQKNGRSYSAIATGFIVGFNDPSSKPNHYTFIVTNKHVVNGKSSIFISLDASEGKRKRIHLSLVNQNNEPKWFAHRFHDVDLVLLPVSMEVIESLGSSHKFIPEELFLYMKDYDDKGFTVGDDVFFLGFPLGLAGELHNSPILRKGTLSRVDRELLKQTKSLLIDGQNFPGNSGGPVFVKPEIAMLENTKNLARNFLVGAVKGYLSHTSRFIDPGNGMLGAISVENSGLALYVPMDYAKEIFNAWLRSGKPIIQ
jgi:S1-C subfamily serine protease